MVSPHPAHPDALLVDGQYTNWEAFAASKNLTAAGQDGDKSASWPNCGTVRATRANSSATQPFWIRCPRTAQLSAPSGVVSTQSFTVTWTGADAVTGVAIFDYTAAGERGAWESFQSSTPNTSAIFANPQAGSNYCFRSRGPRTMWAMWRATRPPRTPASACSSPRPQRTRLYGVNLESPRPSRRPTTVCR